MHGKIKNSAAAARTHGRRFESPAGKRETKGDPAGLEETSIDSDLVGIRIRWKSNRFLQNKLLVFTVSRLRGRDCSKVPYRNIRHNVQNSVLRP